MPDGTPNAGKVLAPILPAPLECELVDEYGQAHLLIDDGRPARSHPLILRVTNHSGHDLAWLAEGDPRCRTVQPGEVFHHLRLSFRPGVLSDAAQALLKAEPDLALQKKPSKVLGSSSWRIVAATEDGEHNLVLQLASTATDRSLPVGTPRELTLLGLFGKGGPARLTRVAVQFAQLGEAGCQVPSALFPSRRRCQLTLLHGGRRDAPLRIGFEGTGTISADGQPTELMLVLHNPGRQWIGAVAEPAPAGRLQLTIENNTSQDWALWQGRPIEEPKKPVAHGLWPANAKTPLQAEHGDDFLAWSCELPRECIAPQQSLRISLTGLCAFREGTTNLDVDLYNIPGFADSRTVLTVTRSAARAELDQMKTNLDEVASRLRNLEKEMGASSLRIDAAKAMDDPMVPFADRISLAAWSRSEPPEIDPKQHVWAHIPEIKALDVSTSYVLAAGGRVYSTFGGRILAEMPPLPKDPDTPDRIGEFCGRPVVISTTSGRAYWFDTTGWTQVATNSGASICGVGEGWVMLKESESFTPAWLQFAGAGDVLARTRIDSARYRSFTALGGSPCDPVLVVSLDGKTHTALRREADWLATGKWGPVFSLPADVFVRDVNAGGVIIIGVQNSDIFRCSNGQWFKLTGGGTRVGGTWRNPLVVGGGDNRALYRLRDAE